MIDIISHRGLWANPKEKNTLSAFEESLKNNFGIETDIRDYNGEIVISHDIPIHSNELIYFNDFINLYKSFSNQNTLAINIKSDGLSNALREMLKLENITNYFVFDMSIPETISYKKNKLIFYTRQSEFEKGPVFYDECYGVWLDQFTEDWVDQTILEYHHNNNKKICIVSPELHGRDYLSAWEKYKNINKKNTHLNFIICTDHPLEARSFFE